MFLNCRNFAFTTDYQLYLSLCKLRTLREKVKLVFEVVFLKGCCIDFCHSEFCLNLFGILLKLWYDTPYSDGSYLTC